MRRTSGGKAWSMVMQLARVNGERMPAEGERDFQNNGPVAHIRESCIPHYCAPLDLTVYFIISSKLKWLY
jgi:hypothetical protein